MKATKLFIFIIIIVVLILPASIQAEESAPSPWKSYQKGVDFYRQRDYDKAGDNFHKSLNTDDRTLEEWASYNSGNTAYEKAQAIEKQDPPTALKIYQEALEYYRRAITADQRDKDAKFNYELTAKKVKELDQQQKPSGQKQQNKQDKQKSGQDKNKSDSKNNQADKDKGQNQQKNMQQDTLPPDKQAEQNQPDKPKEQTAKEGQGQQGRQQQMSKDEALMLLNNFQR
ncbi:MAG: hypothetical protein HY920_08465, partial [Elusimicrobia bacterium]|nr:hypothetical protein [Elusimicrobiota bacterium]